MSESSHARLLVVEDDDALRELLVEELEAEAHIVVAVATAEQALELLAGEQPDLIISDLKLPGASGLSLLSKVRELPISPMFLMITAYGTVSQAVEALKAGADDFLTKPLDMEHLLLTVARLLETRTLRTQLERYRSLLTSTDFHGLVGRGEAMRELAAHVRQMAGADGPVLIQGESGTGKELVARAVHQESPRASGPFLAVNCAGVSPDLLESEFFGHAEGAFTGARKARPGLFAEADGGTLLLDEIGEMPMALQAKLLRALQDGRIRRVGDDHEQVVDVRIVAATNRDLHELVGEGQFREDLFFRLETFGLRVAPLRQRREDIDLLASHFLKRIQAAGRSRVERIGEEALALLRRYDFPGNVRELENAIERAAAFCEGETIEPKDLPERIRQAVPRRDNKSTREASSAALPNGLLDGDFLPTLEELRKRYVHYVLERVEGNKRRAAALLGVGRRTLYRWLDD